MEGIRGVRLLFIAANWLYCLLGLHVPGVLLRTRQATPAGVAATVTQRPDGPDGHPVGHQQVMGILG